MLTEEITADQIARIFSLVRQGKSGVWETTTLYIERLGFHFEQIRLRLANELLDSDSKYVANLVTAIGEFYEREQLTDILNRLLKSRSKKVKERTLDKILGLRLSEMKDDLIKLKETEDKNEILDHLDFIIKHIDTPKGDLIV